MSALWRRFWVPRKSFAEWIDKRIDSKLSHRIEARAQLATMEAVSQAEQNAAYRLEVHTQLILAQVREQIAYMAESRAQIASMEARAYADSGLHALSGAIAAANKAIAEYIKRFSAFERVNAGILQKFELLDGAILNVIEQRDGLERGTELTCAQFDDFKESVNNPQSGLNGTTADYSAQLRTAERRIEFIGSDSLFEQQAPLIKQSIQKPVGDRREAGRAKLLNEA